MVHAVATLIYMRQASPDSGAGLLCDAEPAGSAAFENAQRTVRQRSVAAGSGLAYARHPARAAGLGGAWSSARSSARCLAASAGS